MDLINTPQQAADALVDELDSKFFKTLSEPVRLEILKLLILNGRSDITTIAAKMPQDRSVISRHLNLMLETGILNCHKITRHRLYEVNAQAFLDKIETIAGQIRLCMTLCCPVAMDHTYKEK